MSDLINSKDLNRDEYFELLANEYRKLYACSALWSGKLITEAFEKRSADFRCCCCHAYVSPTIHGYYDGSTCTECGCAQEESEEEAMNVSAARSAALVKTYAKRLNGTTLNRTQGRRLVNELLYSGAAPVWPALAVKIVRRDNAAVGL